MPRERIIYVHAAPDLSQSSRGSSGFGSEDVADPAGSQRHQEQKFVPSHIMLFLFAGIMEVFSFFKNVLYDRVILFIPGNKLLCVRINATFFYDNNTVVCIQPQDERYKYVTIGIIIIETAYLTVYFSLLRYTRT